MSCEWIFDTEGDCPKCSWPSYGARFVYGDKAYKFKTTQEPWIKKKLSRYLQELLSEINVEKKQTCLKLDDFEIF